MLMKKGKSTRFISAALAAIIASFSAMSAFSVASAQENQVGTIHCIDEQYVDPALVEAVADCVENCEAMADVSNLNVQTSQLSYLINVLKNNYPQLFYFSGFSFMTSGGRIVAIKPKYLYSTSEIQSRRQLFDAAVNACLAKVSGGMSDFEKALILHDEIAVLGKYAYRTTADYIMIEGLGQCSSYAGAYSYLLSLAGIDSEIVESESINHAWNKVCIGGSYYNVDLTWDDSVSYWIDDENGERTYYDNLGHAFHNYFLKSDYVFQNDDLLRKHTGYTSLFSSPTTYDNLVFSTSSSKFCYENGELYYIDNESSQHTALKKYNAATNTSQTVKTLSGAWSAGNNMYYVKSYATLASENGILYYNDQNSVYAYNILSGEETLYSNNSALQDKCYGVKVENGGVYAAVNDSPQSVGSWLYLGDTIHVEPPTTEAPTTVEPTTIEAATTEPTTDEPTTIETTTAEPTTVETTTTPVPTPPATAPQITTEPKQFALGDVNLDEYLSIHDVTSIQKHLAGLTELSSEALAVSDVDHDGTLTINDATRLQLYLAFLIDAL